MLVTEIQGLIPPMLRQLLLVTEKGDDAALIVHISTFANEWILHLVNFLLEVLLVLASEQFLDTLQTPLTFRDRVDLNALD